MGHCLALRQQEDCLLTVEFLSSLIKSASKALPNKKGPNGDLLFFA